MSAGRHRRGATRLSKRELEVLALVALGLTDREIAAQLGLATKTVNHHVGAICAKLGARRRTDAVTRALARGLLTLRGDETSPSK